MHDQIGADAKAEDRDQRHQHDRAQLAAHLARGAEPDPHGLLSAGSLGIGGAGALGREPSAGPTDAGPLMFGIACV